jgi:hypothetical protein
MGPGHVTANLLLLAHKTLGYAISLAGGLGILSAVDFSGSITLGSILIAIIIAAMAAFFTMRSKIATIWRQEAEGERAVKERLRQELADVKAERAAFEITQQELRHDLKDKIAGLDAQLKVMEAKTDLEAALDAIKLMNEHTTESVVQAMHKTSLLSEQRDGKTQALLEEIRDKLPTEPFAVDVIHEPTGD